MSRTDKTAPVWVRVMNRPSYLEEFHDHTNGRECDLPAERKPTDQSPWGGRGLGCRWVASHEFMCDRENWCGCPLCSDTDNRKAKARQARAEGRAYARRLWRREYE